ncbi:MAG: hypothetical protein WC139_08830 [Candidatus Kapaibacterium sp.]
MKNILNLFLIFLSLVLVSCGNDNVVNSLVTTSDGVFLLSEGSFSAGSSKLSYYDITKDSFFVNVVNPYNLGAYPDGMIKHSGSLYITEQGNYGSAGKIYRADLNATILSQQSIGLNPFSLCASNDKLYSTNGPSSNVLVIDPMSLNVLKEIPVGAYPQEIMSYNNRVFVCNTSMYGGASDSTVSVIDAGTDAVVNTLHVDKDPSSLIVANNNKLLVSSWSTAGKIYVFETVTFTLVETLYSPYGFSKDFSADRFSNDVYFVGNDGDIIKLNMDTKQFTKIINKPALNSFIYGYVFDYISGKHFLADAKDFMSSGNLYIYDANGSLLRQFETGIAPRRFLININ